MVEIFLLIKKGKNEKNNAHHKHHNEYRYS